MTLANGMTRIFTRTVAVLSLAALAGCGGGFSKGGFSRGGGSGSGSIGSAGLKGGGDGRDPDQTVVEDQNAPLEARARKDGRVANRKTLFSLFQGQDNPNVTVEVNKYIWNAALDVLNFLPIQAADPFSGVIVTGYGKPPGGGRAYRATIYVQDPALDARSLHVALQSRSGPVSADTVRAIEDAILTRARQLRIRDSKL